MRITEDNRQLGRKIVTACILTIQIMNRKIIQIYQSYTASSTTPISHTCCTALSNFITAYIFGYSHPLLTLNHYALITDQELPHFPPADHNIKANLLRHNFSLVSLPAGWPEYHQENLTNSPSLVSSPVSFETNSLASPSTNSDLPIGYDSLITVISIGSSTLVDREADGERMGRVDINIATSSEHNQVLGVGGLLEVNRSSRSSDDIEGGSSTKGSNEDNYSKLGSDDDNNGTETELNHIDTKEY